MKSSWASWLLLCSIAAVLGCSPPVVRHDPGHVLPFIVRLRPIRLAPGDSSTGEALTPASFGSDERLTSDFAQKLDQTGVFGMVVTDEEGGLAPDLDLWVEISGADFGESRPLVKGGIFSTLTWLLAGHLSWLIDDRHYPDSKVSMKLFIQKPSSEPNRGPDSLFIDELPLKSLELSFSERANFRNWIFNILEPPLCVGGDPSVAGRSLARKSLDSFANREADQIVSRLPFSYFDEYSTFLIHDRGRKEIVIVSHPHGLTRLVIADRGGVRDDYKGAKVTAFEVNDEEQKREIRGRFSDRFVGIDPENTQYRFPLAEDGWDYLRVEATAWGGKTGRWSLFSAEANSRDRS